MFSLKKLVIALALCVPLTYNLLAYQINDKTPDGLGIKAQFPNDVTKTLIHVEGSPYEMGFQHGWLMADEIKLVTSKTFFKQLALSFFGSDPILAYIINDDLKLNVIFDACLIAAKTQSLYIPAEQKDEMRGIAEGATARLRELGDNTKIKYDHVLINNIGFDLLLSFGYNFIVKNYIKEDAAAANARKIRIMECVHMCDGFVVGKKLTTTGGTLMGRNLMAPRLLSNMALVIEYKPLKGNRFVSVTFPGFVGTPAAMNEHGLCIGMNTAQSLINNPAFSGMGSLLITRKVAQYANSVSEAVSRIKNVKVRGCSWIYILGDKNNGAIVEAGPTVTFNLTPIDKKLFGARFLQEYPSDAPAAVPANSEGTNNYRLICSNHFLIPVVKKCTKQYTSKNSKLRQNLLEKIVNEEALHCMSFQSACKLTNYLSPLQDNPYYERYFGNGFQVKNYYKNTSYVQGARITFDMKNMRLRALFKNWFDNWIEYSWHNPLKK